MAVIGLIKGPFFRTELYYNYYMGMVKLAARTTLVRIALFICSSHGHQRDHSLKWASKSLSEDTLLCCLCCVVCCVALFGVCCILSYVVLCIVLCVVCYVVLCVVLPRAEAGTAYWSHYDQDLFVYIVCYSYILVWWASYHRNSYLL